ncbi:MaoC/PaaZ C-terminal domain-containing protein [Amycolatopsis jejuensis]|uniref:MaoC/PaaZ C-terminal domain-containing protein n=1 Tax=Amycolatopsis jejuensis TaxID=330084 RepID=UPI0005246FB5|nr:MaoC/PaaZ C-terminal domain-containing protein [Amycolatopsis jejuensis]
MPGTLVDPSTLAVGGELEPFTYPPLTRTDIAKYQGASGDWHPLHHDEEYARRAGFPTVFSVGMLQAGMLASFVTSRFGVRGIRRFSVRFVEQVWPGDELTCSATVSSIAAQEDGRRLVELELRAIRQTGGVALSGKADLILP